MANVSNKPEKKKKPEANPRRLLNLLRGIRRDIFEASTIDMADMLNGVTRMGSDDPIITFNSSTVKNLEAGKIEIRYVHLECYANLFGLPVGAFMLVSRFQHEPIERVEQFLHAFNEVFQRSVERREIVTARQLVLLAENLGWVGEFGQAFPRSLRSPGKARPYSTLERLERYKLSQEKLGTDPMAGLSLWDYKEKHSETN